VFDVAEFVSGRINEKWGDPQSEAAANPMQGVGKIFECRTEALMGAPVSPMRHPTVIDQYEATRGNNLHGSCRDISGKYVTAEAVPTHPADITRQRDVMSRLEHRQAKSIRFCFCHE
jgi:hypothetical protein